MKLFILDTVSSVLRFILVAFGGWLTANAGVEITQGGLDTATLAQVVGGLVMAGLSFAMKQIDAMGGKGRIAKLLIGPRVNDMGHSLTRWAVGLIGGLLVAVLPEEAISVDRVGDTSITEIIVLLVAFGYDRVSKAVKP